MRTLTNEQKELLRDALLQTAHSAAPAGCTVRIFKSYARATGFRDLADEEIEREVLYLVDCGMLVALVKEMSAANKAWRITAKGTDHLETEGLA